MSELLVSYRAKPYPERNYIDPSSEVVRVRADGQDSGANIT